MKGLEKIEFDVRNVPFFSSTGQKVVVTPIGLPETVDTMIGIQHSIERFESYLAAIRDKRFPSADAYSAGEMKQGAASQEDRVVAIQFYRTEIRV
jgi:hypothetical protein